MMLSLRRNVIMTLRRRFDVIMTLLLRGVYVGIELPCHLSHTFNISNTLQTGCNVTAVVVGST